MAPETKKIDPRTLRSAFRAYREASTAALMGLSQKLQNWDDLTVSEQQALYGIVRPHYDAITREELRQKEKQHRVLETLRLLATTNGQLFTVESLATSTNHRHQTDVKWISVNRIIDSLIRQGEIYIARGFRGGHEAYQYGFTAHLPAGTAPPTMNDRRHAVGRLPLPGGNKSDQQLAEETAQKRDARHKRHAFKAPKTLTPTR